jgi:hypothetical protein
MYHINIIGNQLPAQHFTVHHVLTAAKGNDVNLVLPDRFCLHNLGAKLSLYQCSFDAILKIPARNSVPFYYPVFL